MAKRIAATYGDSLFSVALEQKKIDEIYDEVLNVNAVFADNDELTVLLNHPRINKDEKIKVVENIFEKFVSKEVLGFLVTVITKDRLNEISDIFQYFIEKVKEYKRIGTAYVSTPMELSDAMKEKVHNKLIETTDYEEVDIIYTVDPSLIGGMVIRIGDRIVDSSIKNKLQMLTRELQKLDV